MRVFLLRAVIAALPVGALGCEGTSVVGASETRRDDVPTNDASPDSATADVATAETDAGVAVEDVPAAGVDVAGGDVPACPVDPGATSPESPTALVARIKNLLTALPPTDAEVAAVTADRAALDGLIGAWMTLPTYREKLLRFFAGAFQQDQFTNDALVIQFEQFFMFEPSWRRFVENLQESFARTALAIVDEGRPFTETMTTTRFMMTPALMAAYAVLDNLDLRDDFASADRFQRDYPTRVVVQSARPVPLAHSVDPAHPDYMTFYSSVLGGTPRPGCPTGEVVYPAPAPYLSVAMVVFNQDLMRGVNSPCGILPRSERLTEDADFTAWRMVSLRRPAAGERPTAFFDLPRLRTARELVVEIPRVGFFSTPAFLARWPTNNSNLARVQINQTMIVAVGRAFDLTNLSVPDSTAAVDAAHAAPDSTCYGCHVTLDPMRQYFRRNLSIYSGRQADPRMLAIPAQFAFQGVTGGGSELSDLGRHLAGHPRFAAAWTQRLCAYANSAPCDEADPEFVRVAAVFRDSRYDWSALVRALFASRLVTHVRAATPSGPPVVPIARQEHLCALLSARLRVDDVCGLRAATADVDPSVHAVAASWPAGQISRGEVTTSFAVAPTITARGGIETLCASLANRLVDGGGPLTQFQSARREAAVADIVARLVGATGARARGFEAILNGHVQEAQRLGATPSDALRSAFVLACTSVPVVGVGF